MAVIKSGDTTDQLHVDTHQSAYVTLRDASGAAVAPLPSGGTVSVSNFPAVQPVTGTFFQAIQPVNLASVPLPANAATESGHLASIDTKLTGPLPVTGAFFQTTQPVSLASAPLPPNAATETGGNLAGLNAKVTTTANGVKVDGSAVIQPVSGSVTVSAIPAISGTVAVTNFPATQPVSAVALPLPTGAATDANLTARLPLASNGGLEVTVLDGFKATYMAGTAGFAPAAAATDVLTITGSATKVIRITKVYLSFTATTAVSVPVSLIRRSAANTGGTSTPFAATPRDTTNPAATAAVAIYTANPTALGAAVGSVLEAGKIPAPLTGGAVQVTVFEFGTGSNQAIVLRGTSQVLAVSLNSVTVTGGSMTLAIQWLEE